MPDIVTVMARRWKLIMLLTLLAAVLSLLICLFITKKYVGVATALTANPLLSDKARIFNQNIEGLYTALGSADDLDRVEGTAKLDTVYLALAKEFNLTSHYNLNGSSSAAIQQTAIKLRKNTTVNRTGYGELRIRVWDKNNVMAAALANAFMQALNNIHEQVQMENTRLVLQRLKEEYTQTRQALQQRTNYVIDSEPLNQSRTASNGDSSLLQQNLFLSDPAENAAMLRGQLAQYARLIGEYELALKTAPKVLLVVEHARPSPWHDKPKTVLTVLIATVAAFLFSFLLALIIESRNPAT